MIAYLIMIARIFSEQFEPLSAVIGVLLIVVFLAVAILGKIRTLKGDYFFIKFMLVYVLVNALWGLVSLYNFGTILVSPIVYELAKPLSLICFYWVMRNGALLNVRRYNGLLMMIIAIYAGIGYYSGMTVASGMVARATWPAAHHNYIGVTFAILLAYVIFSDQNKFFRLIMAGGLFIGLGATKSLSALLLFGTTVGLYYVFKRNLVKIAIIGGAIVLIFMVAGEFFWQKRMVEFSENLKDFMYIWQTQPEIFFGDSSKWRIVNWSLLFGQFEIHPYLGWGTLSYKIVNPMRMFRGTLGGYHPHSEFLKWLVCFGITGTIILMSTLLYYAVKSAFDKYKDMPLVNAITLGSIIGTFFGSGFMYQAMMMIIIIMICKTIPEVEEAHAEEPESSESRISTISWA